MRKHCGNCANHSDETNRFSEECGKCVVTVSKNRQNSDPSHWKAKPQTNADKIRAMSDEELRDFLCTIVPMREKLLLRWLKSPIEEG